MILLCSGFEEIYIIITCKCHTERKIKILYDMLDNLQNTGRMKIVMTNTLWMDLKVLKWKSFGLVLKTGSILNGLIVGGQITLNQ